MKLRNKLILSCAALAACATTMVSTTFAWYTSNTEVSAGPVSGTSQANGDSLLLISSTGLDGSYSNSVTLDINTDTLIPVEYTPKEKETPSFKGWGNGAVAEGQAASGAVLTFPLYFRGVTGTEPTGVNVYLKGLSIVNDTAKVKLPTKDILDDGTSLGTNTDGAWDFSRDGSTYSVDVLRTVNIAYTTETQSDNQGTAKFEYVSQGCLNPEGLLTFADTLSGRSNFSAHKYYTNVTGKQITDTDTLNATNLENGTTEVNLGVTPNSTAKNNALRVTFYVFINGWDLACFDAVQGQKFTINMQFSSEKVAVSNNITK